MARRIKQRYKNLTINMNYISLMFVSLILSVSSCKTNSEQTNTPFVEPEVTLMENEIKTDEHFIIIGFFDYDDKPDSLFYKRDNMNGEPLYKCRVKFGKGGDKSLYVPTGSGNIMFKECVKGCIEKNEINTGILGSENIEKYFYDETLNNWLLNPDSAIEQWSIDAEILKIKDKEELLSLYYVIEGKFNEEYFYDIQSIAKGLNLKSEKIFIDKKSLEKYNNLAFYFEQSEVYILSVMILEKIISKFPDRTVAYINLGDAYNGLKNTEKAKEAYSKYVEMMKANNKEDKIPQRIWDNIK